MRYVRPSSIEDAVDQLIGSDGAAAILAGGSDLLVRMKGGFIEPDLIVDIKSIAGLSDIRETPDGFSIGAAVPCAVLGENNALKQAWPGVVEAAKLDRLEAGAGPLHHRRQSLQRLAGGRQRSGAGGRWRQGVDRRARRQAHCPRGDQCRQDRARRRSPRARSSRRSCCTSARRIRATPICASSRAPRWTSRWSAPGVHLTLDEGGVVTAARVALGAVAPTVLLVPRRAEAIIGTQAGRSGAGDGSPRRARQPAGRSTTSGEPSNSEGRLRACWPGGPPRSPMHAQEENDGWYSSFNDNQRRHRRIPVPAGRDSARRAARPPRA